MTVDVSCCVVTRVRSPAADRLASSALLLIAFGAACKQSACIARMLSCVIGLYEGECTARLLIVKSGTVK